MFACGAFALGIQRHALGPHLLSFLVDLFTNLRRVRDSQISVLPVQVLLMRGGGPAAQRRLVQTFKVLVLPLQLVVPGVLPDRGNYRHHC